MGYQFHVMHFLLFFLVILSGRPSDAVTSTKINYLPNGQVGGYELIINNTVQSRIHPPLPQDRVSKIVKHTSNFGSTFTRVDEQVIGENSYLNVHSILKQQKQLQQPMWKQPLQQQVRMKYPVKTVLMVPSVRYVNGVPENVKLRFAQIGSYAALIVPVKKSEGLGDSDFTVPPEIRDSVKAYIEVQERAPLAQSSQKTKTGYPYAPPTYKNPSSTEPVSPGTTPNVNLQQSGKTGNYIYPEATSSLRSPTPRAPEIENANNNGFVIRVVNPENSQDSGNRYQEFFAPARSDQIEPDKDDKTIANPSKYSGSSGPSSSQFGEVYSKDNPSTAFDPSSEYSGRTNDALSADQLPESAADLKDPVKATTEGKTDISNIGKNVGPFGAGKQADQEKDSHNGHFQSGWSLVETQDPEPGYNPFRGPPPDQPEFSDVSPDSDLTNLQSQQAGLESNSNDPNLKDSSFSDSPRFTTTKQPFYSQTDLISGVGQTSDATASSSASVDTHLEIFGRPATQDAKHIPKLTSDEPSSTQPLFHQDSDIINPANSAQAFKTTGQRFHGPSVENEEQIPSMGFSFSDSVDKSHQDQDDTALLPLNDKSVETAVESAQKSDSFQENNFGQLSNANPVTASSDSGLEPERFKGASLENVGQISNEGSISADSDKQLGQFQGTRPSFERFPNDGSGSVDQFQGTTLESDASSSATSDSVQQFGENLGSTAQNHRNDAATKATSSANQLNQFQDTSARKFGQSEGSTVDSNLRQFGRFQGSAGQNLGQFTNEGFKSIATNSDLQFKQFQGTSAQNVGQISTDSSSAVHSAFQLNKHQDIIRPHLDYISKGEAALVAVDSGQQLNQFQSQKEGQVLNTGHRNIALTTIGSGNLQFVDDEKVKSFTRDPSLTTQLRFLSPNGQAAAVLTSTGDLARVELPSRASLSGQFSGNIVLPKTVVPLPTSGGGTSVDYKDGAILLNSEYNQPTTFPSARHQYSSFGSLRNVQNNVNSVYLGNQQQDNVFDSTANFKPVSSLQFNPVEAAAAAVAAVKADNEHFNKFDSSDNLQANQVLVSDTVNRNQQLRPYETITGARRPIRPGSGNSEIGEVLAVASAAADYNKHILTSLNSGGVSFGYKDQAGNKNILDEHNKGSDAQFTDIPTFTHSQFSEDEHKFKEGHLSSQFQKDATTSGNLNFRAHELVGNSHINFALTPVGRPNAAFLSTPNGHTVNVHIPEANGKSRQHGEIVIPKYVIREASKARIPINHQTGGSVTLHDRYASAYGRYVTPAIRQYNEYAGVRVVASKPVSVVGPHTEGILETLNGLVTVPKRQLPIPVAT